MPLNRVSRPTISLTTVGQSLNKPSRRIFGATCVVALVTATACSSTSPGTAGSGTSESASPARATADPSSKTLNVWLMQGSITDAAVEQAKQQFQSQSGATIKIEVQQWDNINTKLATALATSTPPDVVEMGNTDVPLFAANGALADITAQKSILHEGSTWLAGLEGPATVDGKLYAAPYYGGAHAVVYNKSLWKAAGISTPPTTYAELTHDLDLIKQHNSSDSSFSAFYLAGADWHNGLDFVYGSGGALASQADGKWKGQLSTPASQAGLKMFKQFQNTYSTPASQSATTSSPDQNNVFATGKTATILAGSDSIQKIKADNTSLKATDIGSFPFPNPTKPGTSIPVFLGGTDLGIAAKSPNHDLAMQFVKMMTSSAIQLPLVAKASGNIPVTQAQIDKMLPTLAPEEKAFYEAAKVSVATPATPGWATIESDKSIDDAFSQIATGHATTVEAAKTLDSHLDAALNAQR